jgi:hypothetical protein
MPRINDERCKVRRELLSRLTVPIGNPKPSISAIVGGHLPSSSPANADRCVSSISGTWAAGAYFDPDVSVAKKSRPVSS